MNEVFFGKNKFIGPLTITRQCGRGGKGIKTIITLDLPKESNFNITVECQHGQRQIRWCRRYQSCRRCVAEAGLYNTSLKGREITWGDKISKAKKSIAFSDDHKKSLSITQYGVSEENWPGFYIKGKTHKLRDSIEYRDFIRSVMIRDDFTCQISGKKGKLNVHHLDSINIALEKALDYTNVITLHEDIHKLFHDLYGRGDNDRIQFEEFKQLFRDGAVNV